MLEVLHLKKTYKPKSGLSVAAVKDVSIRFPEKGMVFLLGKSGSGKSTLLNLIGGLDRYDEGDIVLDGVSTKNFSQSDFDSYRNACVGFIFQEYNVLPEFTVGVNIALAIELQGRKATSEEISAILEEVDLANYANRRPNELSGGQLQRVAIARALVKNPKMILADEPTGALDSKTGRAVFELLKKLSETKLVIIVSHDREYSEQFADRIIELADGEIISDVEKTAVTEVERKPVIANGTCKVPGGYELTEADREMINRYLADHAEEKLKIRVDDNLTRGFSFATTDESDYEYGEQTFTKTKSKLPMTRAFRIGVSSLKNKKVKLFFTLLMSTIAFCLFGFASTLADYNYEKTVSKVFLENDVKTVYTEYEWYETRDDGIQEGFFTTSSDLKCSDEEMASLIAQKGVTVYPVRKLGSLSVDYLDGMEFADADGILSVSVTSASRFLEISADMLPAFNAELVLGELPDGSRDEIAISKVTYEMIRNSALLSGSKIPKMSDMIGKTFVLSNGTKVTVSGIIDTKLDYMEVMSKIISLIGEKGNSERRGTGLDINFARAALAASDFAYDMESNLASCILVGKGFIERQKESFLIRRQETFSLTFGSDANKYASSNVYYLNYGDIAAEKEFKTVSCAPDTYADESGVVCVVNRRLITAALRGTLSADNRKFLGIEKAAYEKFNQLAAKDGGTLLALPDDLTPPESYNLQPNLDSIDTRLNNAYLESLSNAELAELVAKIQSYAPLYITRQDAFFEGIEDCSLKLCAKSMILETDASKTVEDANREYEKKRDDSILLADPGALAGFIGKTDAYYCGAMVVLPTDRQEMRDFIKYTYEGVPEKYRFQIITKYTVEFDGADIVMNIRHKVLLVIGIVFAVFAALMLTSFIATSIAYKRQEVGILRAIGSRGGDVFRIFGSESATIASFCFVLSTLITGILTALINGYLVEFWHVSLMEFGLRQVLLIFAVTFVTAMVATFLPV